MSDLLLDRLARHCIDTSYQDLSTGVVHQVKRVVLDYVGCALGAYRLGIHRDLIESLSQAGGLPEAMIWGHGSRVPASQAALAIGSTASHLEFDPHLHLVPAAITTAEMLRSDGKALITAIAAAFDVASVIKELFASEIEAHGLHWPAQIGVFSAAAAACMLLHTSQAQFAGALGLAGCLTPVVPFEAFTQGAAVKDIYGGWPGMIGVLAARWSQIGLAGPVNLFEGQRGLGRTWLHAPPSPQQISSALSALDSRAISEVSFKRYAACGAAHPTLMAIEDLKARHPELDPAHIARIEVGTYGYAAELSESSLAERPISARVNIPYLCAVFLLENRMGAELAEEPFLSDPRIHELAAQVSLHTLPDMEASLRGRRRQGSVAITMRDGSRLEASVDPVEWKKAHPISDAWLESKFARLVGDLLPQPKRQALVKTIWNLEAVADVYELVQQLIR